MRIIAGAWRGRVLLGPSGSGTRPTADRARQALFDMLAHATWARTRPLADASVLDAFAGTGALGLEALSRGAATAVFMENDRAAMRTIRANVERCGAARQARLVACDVLQAPAAPDPVDYAFLDPPYGSDAATRATHALLAAGWLSAGTTLIVETGRDQVVDLPGVALAERAHGAVLLRVHRI